MKVTDRKFSDLVYRVKYIRKRRYEIYKDIPSAGLLELTIAEYQFLDLLAKKIEDKTNHDCYLELVKIYGHIVKKYINEQPSVGMQRFQVVLGVVERKYKRHVLNVELFGSNNSLENLMGEAAKYNGENALMQSACRSVLKPKLIEFLGENGYGLLNELENNEKSLQEMGEENGISRETIRQKINRAVKGKCCKKGRFVKRKQLSDLNDILLEPEITELDTTFVKQK